jgi:hypothetical protein
MTDDNADDGWLWLIDGELVQVTDVAGTTSPQTATVVRSLNGIVKSHSAGAVPRLTPAPHLAL